MYEETIKVLRKRLDKVSQILSRDIPQIEGSIQCYLGNNPVKYYRKTAAGIEYLGRGKENEIRLLAQKRYEQRLHKLAQKEKRVLETAIALLGKARPFESVGAEMSEGIMRFVIPHGGTDEDFVKSWLGVRYNRKPVGREAVVTARGESVRSKSEAIIADRLLRAGVPYRYEFPVNLGKDGLYHPDFMVLNRRTRQEFFWEHFGMLDNPGYAYTNIRKLRIYAAHGLYPGVNLILTAEAEGQVLDTQEVEALIRQYLL